MRSLQGRRILVTGGSGFLGGHLLAQLRQIPAVELAHPRSSEYDLRYSHEIDALLTRFRPEVILHLAAVVGGIGANQAYPGRFFYENAIMGIQLMEAARLAGVDKFVTVGTVCAYPRDTPTPFRETSLWDGYPEDTNAPYGLAKKMLLVQGQAYRQEYGFRSIYLLPTNLYGPGDNFDIDHGHVIPVLFRKFRLAQQQGRDFVELWGDGSPTREFLYVVDAARAIMLATANYDGSEPVNIGSGQEIGIKELAAQIAGIVGFTGEIRWDTSRPNGQPRRCLDTTRAREFGFLADTTLEEGLRATYSWMMANEEGLPALSDT